MSTAEPPVSAAGVGLGYGIAIAVSILILISTIMLASYACVKVKAHGANRRAVANHRSDSDTSSRRFPDEPVLLGLDGSVIEACPKIELGESRRLPKPNDASCSICLTEYLPKETVRCVPKCNHCFHAKCVDEWLRISGSCPLCRNSPASSVVPTPVSTPLAESVPLALNAR